MTLASRQELEQLLKPLTLQLLELLKNSEPLVAKIAHGVAVRVVEQEGEPLVLPGLDLSVLLVETHHLGVELEPLDRGNALAPGEHDLVHCIGELCPRRSE
jgi:hypothetical protein